MLAKHAALLVLSGIFAQISFRRDVYPPAGASTQMPPGLAGKAPVSQSLDLVWDFPDLDESPRPRKTAYAPLWGINIVRSQMQLPAGTSGLFSATIISLALAACASHAPAQMTYVQVQANSTPICEILADPTKYMGRRVVIEAIRKTDNAHYDYFDDPKCASGPSILEIEDAAEDADSSVAAFDQEWRRHCGEEHPLCGGRAHMVVEAEISGATSTTHLGLGEIGRPMARIARVTFSEFERDN